MKAKNIDTDEYIEALRVSIEKRWKPFVEAPSTAEQFHVLAATMCELCSSYSGGQACTLGTSVCILHHSVTEESCAGFFGIGRAGFEHNKEVGKYILGLLEEELEDATLRMDQTIQK